MNGNKCKCDCNGDHFSENMIAMYKDPLYWLCVMGVGFFGLGIIGIIMELAK